MLDRIPHEDQAISGEQRTSEYVAQHEKHAQTQFQAFLSELQRRIRYRPPGGRFLEIGSGPGFLTAMMADQFPYAELNALELSPDMISIAQTVVARQHHPSRVRFIPGSVEDTSLLCGLGKFDLVYSTFSLHHWKNPVRSLRAMARVLKDGGLMMVHDLKRVSWLYWLPFHSGFFQSIRAAYRQNEIRQMLRQAGIEAYEIVTPFPYFWQIVLVQNDEVV